MQVPKMPPRNLPPHIVLRYFTVLAPSPFSSAEGLPTLETLQVCDFAGGILSAQALKMLPLKVPPIAAYGYI